MKRILWSSSAALALAAVVSFPLMAQGPGGAQGRAGRAGAMRPGPDGPQGRGGPGGMLRGIELTDAQREQIRGIHEGAREETSAQVKVGDLHRQLQAAIFADTVDTGKIESLKQSIAQAEAQALTRRIEIETRIAQVLTPGQRATVRERAGRAGPMDGRRGRGGRGAR